MADDKKSSFLSWLSKPESLVGLSAVVISVVAVAVSAYEARIMREWQRAAVWPYVQLSRSMIFDREEFDASGTRVWRLTFNAENVGVGPAQIKDFRVTVDGKPHTTWQSALEALAGPDYEVRYGQSGINGAILPAGEKLQMMQMHDSDLARFLYDNMESLDYEACFCSVFNECWRTTFKKYGESEKVKDCKPNADSFQE